jgi:hypothetical protein
VCAAANGDAMITWIDRGAGDTSAVRARFRTGSVWGPTSLVSAPEDLKVWGLKVACSPDGNHLVLYGNNSVMPRALEARVYDAALGDWKSPPSALGDRSYNATVVTTRTTRGERYVAWEEYDSGTSTKYYMVRSFDGTTWSTPDTLASGSSLYSLLLAAAGDDVHAVWLRGINNELVTRRLAAGTSTWSSETPLDSTSAVQEVSMSGGGFGDALVAWAEATAIRTRAYSPTTQTWASTVTLKEDLLEVGYGSLHSIIDPRRRATVIWTEYESPSNSFSAKARTFR